MQRRYQIVLVLLLTLIASTANAQAVRKTAEASMLVTGSIELNPDGSLHGYTLDQSEKLPPPVVDIVGKSIPTWQFKLSGTTHELVKTDMSLRVVAKPVGDGKYNVAVEGASFGHPGASAESVTYKDRKAPRYPQLAIDSHVSGTVYLLMRVDRNGNVQDAIAEQVNLEQYSTPLEMEKFRKALASASLDAAKKWTFNPPVTGTTVNDPYWVVRVPVNFNLNVNNRPWWNTVRPSGMPIFRGHGKLRHGSTRSLPTNRRTPRPMARSLRAIRRLQLGYPTGRVLSAFRPPTETTSRGPHPVRRPRATTIRWPRPACTVRAWPRECCVDGLPHGACRACAAASRR